jgi:ABC-type antimicrobial peptide transport system permease subunit
MFVRMAGGVPPDPQLVAARLNEEFPRNVVSISSVAAQLAPLRDRPRFLALLFGSLATIVLMLGAVGVYSVVSLELTLRRRDLAIRQALGAPPAKLYINVLRSILAPIGFGMVTGLISAWWFLRLASLTVVETQPGSSILVHLAAAGLVWATVFAAVLPRIRSVVRSPMFVEIRST